MSYSIVLKTRPAASDNYVAFKMTKNQRDLANDCKNQENPHIRGKRRIEMAKAFLLTGESTTWNLRKDLTIRLFY
jgi:hypothetical protein